MRGQTRILGPHAQTGAVLVVSLILLLVMTIIGVTAVRTTVLEEKMAGNLYDLNLAFELSESALRQGERWIDALTQKLDPANTCGTPCQVQMVWLIDTLNPTATAGTWGDNAQDLTGTIPTVATIPEYYVEHEDFVSDSLNLGSQNDNVGRDLFRVTARGVGGVATAQSIVRTTYARRF